MLNIDSLRKLMTDVFFNGNAIVNFLNRHCEMQIQACTNEDCRVYEVHVLNLKSTLLGCNGENEKQL